MQRYILLRVLQGIVTLLALSVVVFLLSRTAGDPVLLLVGTEVSAEEMEEVREDLGLNRPLVVQYWDYLTDIVQGDFGEAITARQPVSELIWDRFPATLRLAAVTMAFAFPVGVVLGVLCAVRRNKPTDLIGRTAAVIAQSLPSFWVGIVLILLFSVTWELLPASGTGGPDHYVLPVISLGGFILAGITRLTRSSMLEVLGSEYIVFARARGTPELQIVFKQALRNAAIPVVTFAAVLFGFLLMGSIVIETVFSWPGLGRLAYQSIGSRDFPVIQAIVLLYGAMFVFLNLAADILYAWLDPRIRYGRRG